MSLGEKIYLAGVLFIFASFMVLMGTLCWLDAKNERIKRRRESANRHSNNQVASTAGLQSAMKHF